MIERQLNICFENMKLTEINASKSLNFVITTNTNFYSFLSPRKRMPKDEVFCIVLLTLMEIHVSLTH